MIALTSLLLEAWCIVLRFNQTDGIKVAVSYLACLPFPYLYIPATVCFQYKNGGSTEDALRTLWEEGGVPRLYKGVSFALVQGPLSR